MAEHSGVGLVAEHSGRLVAEHWGVGLLEEQCGAALVAEQLLAAIQLASSVIVPDFNLSSEYPPFGHEFG